MIQNTPIDMQSATGFALQRSESDSFKTVNHSTELGSENDSAAFVPFEVELEKAAAQSQADHQADQKPNAEGSTEVVVVAAPDPEFSFEVSDETGFKPPEIDIVDDQPKIEPESTPTTQSEPNHTVFEFSDHSQRVAIETRIDTKLDTLDPNLVEKVGRQAVEVPVIRQNAESLDPNANAITRNVSVVSPPNDAQTDPKQTNAAPIIVAPASDTRMIANTTEATPVSAIPMAEPTRFTQTIVNPIIAGPINSTQINSTQINSTQTSAAQTSAAQTSTAQTSAAQTSAAQTGAAQTGAAQTGATQASATQTSATQPVDLKSNAEPASATQIASAPTIDSQTRFGPANATRIVDAQRVDSQASVEPARARQIVATQSIKTPSSADPLAATQTIAAQSSAAELITPQPPAPIVAVSPSPGPSPTASQTPIELEINRASRAPVDLKATSDASQEVFENPNLFSNPASPGVRDLPAVETIPHGEPAIPTADRESSRVAEPLAANTTSNSNRDSFSQSEDGTNGWATEPIEVSTAADDRVQVPMETEFEWVAADPNLQADRSKPTQPAQVSHLDIYVPEPATRFVNETTARPNSFERPMPEIGRIVSQRVSETVIQEIQVGGKDSKQLTLHLHPEELGRLTVQVGWESESIVAKIVASELATSEMLNRDKGWLMDSLQANGLEFDSFEVSYEGSTNDRAFGQNGESSTSTGQRDLNPANSTTNISQTIEGQGSVVNLIA